MYVVRDKTSKKIIHKNPAPLLSDLKPKDVYFKFDSATMEIGKTDGALPEHFDFDADGNIIEWTLERKVKEGVVVLGPNEKIEHEMIVKKTEAELIQEGQKAIDPGKKIVKGKIVEKSLAEQAKEGIIQIGPAQKIVTQEGVEKIVDKTLSEQLNEGLLQIEARQKIITENGVEKIVEKTLEEQVKENLIRLAPNQKIANHEVITLSDREMLDENKITLDEYKQKRIEHFSQLSFTKRQMILPEYKIQNAALGIYNEEERARIKETIEAFRKEFNRLREKVQSAKTPDEVDKVKEKYPEEQAAPAATTGASHRTAATPAHEPAVPAAVLTDTPVPPAAPTSAHGDEPTAGTQAPPAKPTTRAAPDTPAKPKAKRSAKAKPKKEKQ